MAKNRWYWILVILAGIGVGITALYLNQDASSQKTWSESPTSITYPGACQPWQQTNQSGFGLPSSFDGSGQPVESTTERPFLGEESFEVAVFQNQLYVGMEADNALGARLWRATEPAGQADWEEVAADADGHAFGVANLSQVDHIDSLAEFRDWLYASTANRSGSPKGTLVFRSPNGDPGSWENALWLIGPGFGDSANENFKDMQVFENQLCGGTWNAADGAEVWCTPDGTRWAQKNKNGFGDPANIIIWSGFGDDGHLYFGVQNQGADPADGVDDVGKLYRTAALTAEPVWELVFSGLTGSRSVNILGRLDNYIYIATGSPEGVRIYRSPTGAPGTWVSASLPGMDGNPQNAGVIVDGAAIYRENLVVSVANRVEGSQLWRTAGDSNPADGSIHWERLSHPEIPVSNIYAQVIAFNDRLYVWSTNYEQGQQVWQTRCTICQEMAISRPGQYIFDDVGATIDLSRGELEKITVCLHQASPRDELPPELAAAPYYTITASPQDELFKAELTLSYNGAPDISQSPQGNLTLASWRAAELFPCPEQSTERDLERGTISCEEITNFGSIWVITSTEPAPNRTGIFIGAVALAAILLVTLWLRQNLSQKLHSND